MAYFIYQLTPKHPDKYQARMRDEQRLREQHHVYLETLRGQDSLIIAGTIQRKAGEEIVIILRAESEYQARQLMNADPLVHSGLVESELAIFEAELMGARTYSLPK